MSCDIIRSVDSGNLGDFSDKRKPFLDLFMERKGTTKDALRREGIFKDMISHK